MTGNICILGGQYGKEDGQIGVFREGNDFLRSIRGASRDMLVDIGAADGARHVADFRGIRRIRTAWD